jgi:hypothetical protein
MFVKERINHMPFNQALRKNSHVLWTISIIQDISPTAQTNSEFTEMMQDVANTATIEKTTICLANLLQRFRLMIKDNITEEEAILRCDELENKWHIDNAQSVEELKKSKKLSFITWKEFLTWPQYSDTIKAVENFYKENKEFRNDVDGRVRQELTNVQSDAKLTDPLQQTSLLKRYLFEECAFQKFAAEKGFNYELYKTPMNKAMRRIKNHSEFVPPGFMTEIHFTQFNPSKKNTLQNNSSLSNENRYHIRDNKNNFGSVFSSSPPLSGSEDKFTISSDTANKLKNRKAVEFIENAIELLPVEEQENALKALIKFTTQEIMPLYYKNLQPPSPLKTQ